MSATVPDFLQLKAGMKAAWIAGDFGQIAAFTAQAAEDFVQHIGIPANASILDVACGTGNTAIPAAQAGAVVSGIDIAPNLLEQARKRATGQNLKVQFDEGDAEDIPFPSESFDIVLSMFGAMFAPRPDRVAAELLRVCKSGGVIAMANWTPESFSGKTFQIMHKMLPPPPNLPAPVLWGDESTVRERLSPGSSSLNMTRQKFWFACPFSPKQTVEFFRQHFGPTQVAFSRLDPSGQATLAYQLEELWTANNTATDGTTRIENEYLDVRAIRA